MTTSAAPRTPSAGRVHPAYRALLALTALTILLQGVWAGVFLQGGERGRYEGWIEVHGTGSTVAIVLSLLAAVVAFRTMPGRRDVWGGTALLLVLVVAQAAIGGLVSGGREGLTIVHVPLALALSALVVYLSFQARRPARGAA